MLRPPGRQRGPGVRNACHLRDRLGGRLGGASPGMENGARMFTKCIRIGLAVLAFWIGPTLQARAAVIVGSPLLPPAGGVYNPGGGVKALFDFIADSQVYLQIDQPVHQVGLSQALCGGLLCPDPRTLLRGQTQTEEFFSSVRFHIVALDPQRAVLFSYPEMVFDNIRTITRIKRLDDDGPNCHACEFSNELVQLILHGTLNGVDVDVQLDPRRPSTGHTTIEPLNSGPNSGLFRISSFFDVFTELSLNRGPAHACIECGRMELVAVVSEPTMAVLVGTALAFMSLLGRRRRAHRAGAAALP